MNNNNQYLKYINNIQHLIKYYNDLYFEKGLSIIDDSSYDSLVNKLKILLKYNKNNNILYKDFIKKYIKYNEEIREEFLTITKEYKIKHQIKLFSIKSFFSTIDLFNNFIKKHLKKNFYIQPKIDGVSINLTYINGKLKHIASRGNKIKGEDCFFLLPYIKNIPIKLNTNNDYFIKGELTITKEMFNKYNKQNIQHPRNLITSLIKSYKYYDYLINKIIFIAFDINLFNEDYKKKILFLKENKFEIPKTIFQIFNDKSEFDFFHNNNFNKIIKYNYFCDGIVYKIDENSIKKNKNIKFYNNIVAFKKNSLFIVKIIYIKFNISRFGKINPTVYIEELKLKDRTINKMNSTYNQIVENRLNKDCIISITINGMIPILKENLSLNKDYYKINKCISCNKLLIVKGKYLYCINSNCIEKTLKQICFFCKMLKIPFTNLHVKKIFTYNNKINFLYILNLNNILLKKIFNYKDEKINKIIEIIYKAKLNLKKMKLSEILFITSLISNINSNKEKIINNIVITEYSKLMFSLLKLNFINKNEYEQLLLNKNFYTLFDDFLLNNNINIKK